MLATGALLAGALAFGAIGCGDDDSGDGDAAAGSTEDITLQLSWFADESVVGEVVAQDKGFYEDEGLSVKIVPGGPTNDGVAPVAAGKADIGIASDSPSVMLAASEGIPIKAFAAQLQRHPYAYVSLPDTPLESAQDLTGKVVGVAPTGNSLLDAMLAANDMSREDLGGVQPISFDLTPLLQEKVDSLGTWLTDVGQLSQLPSGYHSLSLWDAGVKLYAGLYFANQKLLDERPETAERFVRASVRGWLYARENPTEAAKIFLAAYPDAEGTSSPAEFQKSEDAVFPYMFTETSEEDGWGAMDPDVWQSQIDIWDETGQFDADVPSVDDVMTESILEATADDRTVN